MAVGVTVVKRGEAVSSRLPRDYQDPLYEGIGGRNAEKVKFVSYEKDGRTDRIESLTSYLAKQGRNIANGIGEGRRARRPNYKMK